MTEKTLSEGTVYICHVHEGDRLVNMGSLPGALFYSCWLKALCVFYL